MKWTWRFKAVLRVLVLLQLGFLVAVEPSWAQTMPPLEELRALTEFAKANGNLPANRANLKSWSGYFNATDNWVGINPCHGYKGLRCWTPGNVLLLRLPQQGLVGNISPVLGNLTLLSRLSLGENNFFGPIPPELGRLRALTKLRLQGNQLTGPLPDWVRNLVNMNELVLARNLLYGSIPSGLFSNLTLLRTLDVSSNNLTGPIPEDLVNSSSIQSLALNSNNLTGNVPASLALSTSYFLNFVNLSQNSLYGPLPSLWTIPNLTTLDLSRNNLSGSIPVQLVNLTTLKSLNLAQNNFVGHVPLSLSSQFGCDAFAGNPGLVMEDSSCKLQTVVPTPAPSLDSPPPSPSSDTTNLPVPTAADRSKKKTRGLNTLTIVALTAGDIALLMMSAVGFTLFWLWWKRKKSEDKAVEAAGKWGPWNTQDHKYASPSPGKGSDLSTRDSARSSGTGLPRSPEKSNFVATPALRPALKSVIGVMSDPANDRDFMVTGDMSVDQSVSCDNFGTDLVLLDTTLLLEFEDLLRANAMVLGSGTFGGMYMAVLEDGQMLAIKKLEEQALLDEHAFGKQCTHLAEVMHPNLLQMRAYCWSFQEKLLIFDYMPNGSVASLLHGEESATKESSVDWSTRLKVAVGTARALAHLHDNDMVHGNIKATNVLLDESFEPRLSDFGLEALLQAPTKHTASAGYLAPELGITTRHKSQEGDIYGFGVLLLELLTGLEPMGKNNMDLPTWVLDMISLNRKVEIFDPALVSMQVLRASDVLEFLELAQACVSEDASARPSITVVLRRLESFVPGSAGPRFVQESDCDDQSDYDNGPDYSIAELESHSGNMIQLTIPCHDQDAQEPGSPVSSVGSFFSNVSSACTSPVTKPARAVQA